MKPILELDSIAKSFKINHETQPYLSLRDSLMDTFKSKIKGSKEEFWALKDVSFNVMPGESVGIIGKNGAGKSTLLKILSKITPPTKGRIVSRGRIASLLEVGTGFHPELSGRENIFLNGSILGMKRTEIRENFDAIVDFSGVERFIDTPLKHYSSGMQLRLAFAVAAFLNPEILIIDEVLAVGDFEFQKKCMGKMEEVTKSGRTILFVSHNIGAVKQLCTKGILLQNGVVKMDADVYAVINSYMHKDTGDFSGGDVPANYSKIKNQEIKFVKINLLNDKLSSYKEVGYKEALNFDLHIESAIVKEVMIDVKISNAEGMDIVNTSTVFDNQKIELKKGVNNIDVTLLNNLIPGEYYATFGIHEMNGTTLDYLENFIGFKSLNFSKHTNESFPFTWFHGSIVGTSTWKIKN